MTSTQASATLVYQQGTMTCNLFAFFLYLSTSVFSYIYITTKQDSSSLSYIIAALYRCSLLLLEHNLLPSTGTGDSFCTPIGDNIKPSDAVVRTTTIFIILLQWLQPVKRLYVVSQVNSQFWEMINSDKGSLMAR